MRKFIVLLLILSLIPLLDLFHPGLPVTHDGQDHVARIANFYKNLSDGIIIPRWAPNLNWGYGHPILMFLYPLPSYMASLFHFLGFSLIDSLKIIFGLSFSLSGVFMFLWLREFLDDYASFIGGVLYMFAPYRFVDLYVRGAIGEHVAFIFLPLILYFLLKLSSYKAIDSFTIIGGSLSIVGLLLSHNAISVMFFPVIVLYLLFLIYTNEEKLILAKRYILMLMLGFGLSSFFLLPAFFEGRYTLRDIVTAKDYATRFMDLSKFLYGNWNYGISGQFSVQVGIVQWALTLLAIPLSLFMFKKKNIRILTIFAIALFFLTIFLMIPDSKFIWDKITILQKFQFPWRFLTMSVFTSSVIGAFVFSQLKNYRKLFTVIFIILVLLLNKNYWHANGYLLKDESFFTGIYNGTTDTGESSPIWSVRFMEKRPKGHVEIIAGSAKVKELKRTSTKHEYEITSLQNAGMRENTLYFPGWDVLVDGIKTNIEYQDPHNRGVITFNVPRGNHKVFVQFGETRLRIISDLISLLSLVGILFLWKNKQFRLF